MAFPVRFVPDDKQMVKRLARLHTRRLSPSFQTLFRALRCPPAQGGLSNLRAPFQQFQSTSHVEGAGGPRL